jgi:DNA-damage-inducible protein D
LHRVIKPEELPSAEDIKKVERRMAKEEKDMLKGITRLPKSTEDK